MKTLKKKKYISWERFELNARYLCATVLKPTFEKGKKNVAPAES